MGSDSFFNRLLAPRTFAVLPLATARCGSILSATYDDSHCSQDPPMAMAPTTEQQPQRRDLGQRFFLLGIFAVMVAEVVCTLVNIGQWFHWSSLVLGVVASVGIIYLGNWLYTGDKTA